MYSIDFAYDEVVNPKADWAWLRICQNRRIGKMNEMSLEEALAGFTETPRNKATEHELMARKINKFNSKLAESLYARGYGYSFEIREKLSVFRHFRILQALELMQVGRKRKLMIDDDCLNAYAEGDPDCLQSEVQNALNQRKKTNGMPS